LWLTLNRWSPQAGNDRADGRRILPTVRQQCFTSLDDCGRSRKPSSAYQVLGANQEPAALAVVACCETKLALEEASFDLFFAKQHASNSLAMTKDFFASMPRARS